MQDVIIGVDPHKRSHTAVVLDDNEEILSQVRVAADRRQTERLLTWAKAWPQRRWAIENAHGLGRLLAQQLVRRGETVVDVSAAMSARARLLSGQSGRKSDPADARSVAIAAQHHRRLRAVVAEDLTVVLRLLIDRRWHLVSQRHRLVCRLHVLLADLLPGGGPTHLSLTRAVAVLRRIRPTGLVDTERRQLAVEQVAEWRSLNRQIAAVEKRLRETLQTHGTTLTDLHGISHVTAATIIAIVGDVGRFHSPAHFAAYNGTAPLEASSGDVRRHRLNRRGNRQLNKALHVMAVTQIRADTPGRAYFQRKLAEGKTTGEAMRALKRHLSNVVYRHLLVDAAEKKTVRGGQPGTELASA